MQKIVLLVSGKTFTVDLLDNEAARILTSLLPLHVELQELNGNEKYVYLSDALPTAEKKPKYIHAGDLMLFGSECLVLFYKDFVTPYRYTPLGHVVEAKQLSDALGTGAITAAFQRIPG